MHKLNNPKIIKYFNKANLATYMYLFRTKTNIAIRESHSKIRHRQCTIKQFKQLLRFSFLNGGEWNVSPIFCIYLIYTGGFTCLTNCALSWQKFVAISALLAFYPYLSLGFRLTISYNIFRFLLWLLGV